MKNPAIMIPAEFLNTCLTQGQRAESEKLPARWVYICYISFLSIRLILSLMVSVLVLLKWTVPCRWFCRFSLPARGRPPARWPGWCLRSAWYGFLRLWRSFLRAGLRRPAKQSVILTVQNGGKIRHQHRHIRSSRALTIQPAKKDLPVSRTPIRK